MSDVDDKKAARSKTVRRAALLGIALAIVCHFLPAEYQQVCGTVARIAPVACGL